MKKTIVGFLLFIMLIAACRKNHVKPMTATSSIIGQWTINDVTSFFYDSMGLRGTVHNYPTAGNNIFFRYQFNNDQTWSQSFSSSLQGPFQLSSSGTYVITSDSTFTLFNPNAIPAQMTIPCTISSLTGTEMIFSTKEPTLFNGTDSGYIKAIFRLIK